VYPNNKIVVGRTLQGKNDNLQKVFQRLQEAHLKMNPEKCHLFLKEVLYLGHIVSSEGVTTHPEKLEAVKCWTQLTGVRQVRRFLSLCTHYRRFIPGYADTAKCLT
jgi:hypothetical protein